MRVNVRVEMGNIQKKIESFTQKGQALLSSEVLKDSNYFAPEDTTELINSSIRNSNLEEGRLVWNTPYARRLYYNPQYNFSKDKNPNAGGLWFERAKAAKLPKWKKQLETLKKKMI